MKNYNEEIIHFIEMNSHLQVVKSLNEANKVKDKKRFNVNLNRITTLMMVIMMDLELW